MTDLVAFLRALLDETAARATAATPGPWEWTPEEDVWGQCGPALIRAGFDGRDGRDLTEVLSGWGHDAYGMYVSDADAAHIAHHHPGRVLAEVEAKRQIVNAHGREHECVSLTGSGERSVVDGKPWQLWELEHTADAGPCFVLRCLALPYADHADYREEWRP